MQINISAIELDQSTQCRAEMRQEIIDEYTQSMIDGETFPAIEVYGTKDKCWIADGWHRVLAARQADRETIEADVYHGGRAEAVKAALRANAVHGVRRTNADKRRAVEVALQEFGDLSSRAIADMCGVGKSFVANMRDVSTVDTSTVTGQDGKQYPATKQEPQKKEELPIENTTEQAGGEDPRQGELTEEESQTLEWNAERASMAMHYAETAIWQLKRIMPDDAKRQEALDYVNQWIKEHYHE